MVKKAIIYLPGLNDDLPLNRLLIKLLPLFWNGFEIYVIHPHWRKEKFFTPILNRITEKIDDLHEKGLSIYLFGQSAGGSAVLNAFAKRKNKVNKVVNIGGRLRKGLKYNVFPTLEIAAKGNPAFKESVLLFENKNEKELTPNDRKKILTIRPFFDEIVPSSTVPLEGATNITIPMIQHSLGGISALTIFSSKIRNFL